MAQNFQLFTKKSLEFRVKGFGFLLFVLQLLLKRVVYSKEPPTITLP
jgi:hypothetical protein